MGCCGGSQSQGQGGAPGHDAAGQGAGNHQGHSGQADGGGLSRNQLIAIGFILLFALGWLLQMGMRR